MKQSHNTAPFRERPIFTRYVVIWTLFGTLAAGYLGILGFAPDWLEDFGISAASLESQSNQGQRAAARLATEIATLRESMTQAQLDLAKVKADVQGVTDTSKTLSAQVSALAQKISQPPAPAIDAAAPPADPQAPAAGEQQAAAAPQGAAPDMSLSADDGQGEAAAAAPAAKPRTKVINGETRAAAPGIETGSVTTKHAKTAAADAISFGPAIVKPAAKVLGVTISSGESVDALRLSWGLLSEKNAALKTLEPRYVVGGDVANPTYDLIAGPIKTTGEAKRVCKTLTANSVPCKVGEFVGEAL